MAGQPRHTGNQKASWQEPHPDESCNKPARGDKSITALQITRRFGGHEAVSGVDLSVALGEIYGFLGPNVAGKSTQSAPGNRRCAAGSCLDPKQTAVEMLESQGCFYGLTKAP